ncbi:DUF6471 domain-containing protein [Erythrobacter crassostreae]|uniref:DUF6471 domain-containing protein n=1 Tax=Erythrobacter crassostreae TaxID=2828328 RepID=A0A9X1F3L8_9SPHN|nr:DUF6471 domain-containing protein [Erythrobacter crassostrea]MBV7259356.1 hypothetical protein [Erythrobacter crassostrea]
MKPLEKIEREWATKVIRAHMVKTGVSYADLVERLSLLGIEENERNLRNKVARGTFSAAFMAECLAAIGVQYVDVDIAHEMVEERELIAFEATVARLNAGQSMEEARIKPDDIDSEMLGDAMRVRRGKAGWLAVKVPRALSRDGSKET